MLSQEEGESHALRLGKLFGNLLSLEMITRMALAKLDTNASFSEGPQLPLLTTGQRVEANPLTDGKSLTGTLRQYNQHVSGAYQVETERIVELRDALAHGRMFGFGPNGRHLRLLKFDKNTDKEGRVLVTMAIDMTQDWFDDSIRFLEREMDKVTGFLNYEKRPL